LFLNLKKTSDGNEICAHWGCHVCCIWRVCSPTFSIQCGWFKQVGAVK
jgi:hypothetical protein